MMDKNKTKIVRHYKDYDYYKCLKCGLETNDVRVTTFSTGGVTHLADGGEMTKINHNETPDPDSNIVA